MNINNFEINKEDQVYTQTVKLRDFIDKKVKEKNLNFLINKLSELSDIPESVIEHDFKKFLSENHNFKTGKFYKIFKFSNTFFSSIKFILTLLFIVFFSKKEKTYKKEKVEIIFDEVLSLGEEKRIRSITNEFNSYKIISSIKLNEKINHFIFRKCIGCSREYIFSKFFLYFFKCFTLTFKSSINEKTNLFPPILFLIKKIIKYETIFKKIQSNFLIQERPYTTSSIKKFLFKKYGGKKTSCTQRILFHLGPTSFYINTDILFSLGKKTASILNLTGSKVEKIIPIGSTIFNSKWLESKKMETPKFDIIYLTGNDSPSFKTDKNYINNYYEQLFWLKKISEEFPSLKITIKHHDGNKFNYQKELEILKGTNILIIPDHTNAAKTNYSYGYAINSKVRLTWCSTMGYELLGHNYICYYLDPKMQNISFLHNEDYNKKFRIENYDKFRAKVLEIIESKNIDEIENKEDFCMNSLKISKKIFDNLNSDK